MAIVVELPYFQYSQDSIQGGDLQSVVVLTHLSVPLARGSPLWPEAQCTPHGSQEGPGIYSCPNNQIQLAPLPIPMRTNTLC